MDASRFLRSELRGRVNEGMHSIGVTIAYRTESVAGLLHNAFERIRGTIVRDDVEFAELINKVRALTRSALVSCVNNS